MSLIKDIIQNTKEISLSDTLLEQLMDYERVLDGLNLYVFENWISGELVAGPEVEKYWVSCKFMWPLKHMPDPAGAAKLLDYGCKVTFQKSKLEQAVEVKTPDDFKPGTKYPRMRLVPVWLVEITIPKSLMSDIKRGSLDIEGDEVDLSDVEKAYENELEQGGAMEGQQPGATGMPPAPGTQPGAAPGAAPGAPMPPGPPV
jgi:hypothetical protein